MAPPGNGGDMVAAHVNMMTDTIIANMPENGLRRVMRSLLAAYPNAIGVFETESNRYIRGTAKTMPTSLANTDDAELAQKIVRCMLGAGLCLSSLPVLSNLVSQAPSLQWTSDTARAEFLASLDGDIVQAMTAVQKLLFDSTGSRVLSNREKSSVQQLHDSLLRVHASENSNSREYPYHRGLISTASTLGLSDAGQTLLLSQVTSARSQDILPTSSPSETFQINGKQVSRIFTGLWQLSSPAWGSAVFFDMERDLSAYVEHGFTAFDMADHYGDAEIIFGRFLSNCPFGDAVFTSTKYCVFHKMTVSREAVTANIDERCRRLQLPKIDLLQFHWQFYDDPQYIDALRFISEDKRIESIGLCNLDTKHMERALENGIPIDSNQVQFSLIDSRPIMAMGSVCIKHNIKLLTYGTLLGGFLAEKWLHQPEPNLYARSSTPSQRKYYEMIRNWGDWELFQELLATLHAVAIKHNVSISNVAVRWVLDFPYVGAVIIGARMGISQHTAENLASLGWSLDEPDQSAIEAILKRSKRDKLVEMLGDCGGEYRK